MNTTKFSNILLDKLPKKINNITEDTINVLFDINEVVREINSIDFCNPLGYILTKTLPPDGIVDKLLKGYGNKVTKFINSYTNKFELNSNPDNIQNDIEEIRLLLEDLIIPEELKDIIPGGDKLSKLLQDLNDALVITNTALSISDKKLLIKSLTNRLIPFMNPSNLAEVLLSSKADQINKTLTNIIKPEQFRSSLMRLIKLVNKLNKSINQINNIIKLINKIIKTINVLIKIYKLSSNIIKKLPIPAKYLTSGAIVTSSSKVNKFDRDIDDLDKLLKSVSTFLSTSVIKQITRIRNEIMTLLIGLNQLYENLSSCSYFTNDVLLDTIKQGKDTLSSDLILLEDLFPSIKINNTNNNNSYKGYNITILKEETTDNNTSLLRKRVIVTNSQDMIEYEGTPTYSNKDQILIKEGQYYIDLKNEQGTLDSGTDNITDEEASQLMSQIGLQSITEKEASDKEKEVNDVLYKQIQNSPDDKKLYDSLEINKTSTQVEQIKRIINSVSKQYVNTNKTFQLQNRLNILSKSLLNKGYKSEDIKNAFESSFEDKYNIKIINNNITISKI